MKVFQLLLILCLLFVSNCKTSSQILKCAISNAPSAGVDVFMSTFSNSPSLAYSMLNSSRKSITNYINN